jgi:hypothetical protein
MSVQMSLELSQRLGEHARQRAQMRAENAEPGFTERASDWILWYLRAKGEPVPGEMLTDLCKAHGIKAPDDRAFGAVYKMLVGRNLIRQAGWCERRKGHGCGGGRVWEATT